MTCKADNKCQTQESYIGRSNIEEKSDSKKDIRLQMAILETLACASAATLPTVQSIHILTTHDFVSYHSTYYYTISPLYCKYDMEPTNGYYITDSEPYSESSSKISRCAVYWEGVLPDSSRALTSALCSSNNRATPISPSSTAQLSEVLP